MLEYPIFPPAEDTLSRTSNVARWRQFSWHPCALPQIVGSPGAGDRLVVKGEGSCDMAL